MIDVVHGRFPALGGREGARRNVASVELSQDRIGTMLVTTTATTVRRRSRGSL